MDHASDAIRYLAGLTQEATEARAAFERVETHWVERTAKWLVREDNVYIELDLENLIHEQEQRRLAAPALEACALRTIDWRPIIKHFHRLAEQLAPTWRARAFLLAGRLELRLAGNGCKAEASLAPGSFEESDEARLRRVIYLMLPHDPIRFIPDNPDPTDGEPVVIDDDGTVREAADQALIQEAIRNSSMRILHSFARASLRVNDGE